MGLTLFNPRKPDNDKERIIIYSAPGVGKSRFVLRLTPRFGNILYYAADDNSKFLRSISDEAKERVFVVAPNSGEEGKDDEISNFQTFCDTDWKALEGKTLEDGRVVPKIDTIVVDTYTAVASRTLQDTADQGLAGAEKHFKAGTLTIPNRGDFRGNDSLSEGFCNTLFDKQRDYHIIFVMHEILKYIEDVCVGGGPSHPGRRMLSELPGRFDTVIRLIRDDVLTPQNTVENVVVAITENDGRWLAKVRTGNMTGPNPLARVVLDRDPINFWRAYDELYAPKN